MVSGESTFLPAVLARESDDVIHCGTLRVFPLFEGWGDRWDLLKIVCAKQQSAID